MLIVDAREQFRWWQIYDVGDRFETSPSLVAVAVQYHHRKVVTNIVNNIKYEKESKWSQNTLHHIFRPTKLDYNYRISVSELWWESELYSPE